MLRIGIISLVLGVTILSCQKEENNSTQSESFQSMDFDEMVEGQIFKYTLLEAVGYSIEEFFDFSYTNDTLILEVINVDDNQVVVKESISLGSNMFKSEERYYWGGKDSTYYTTWTFENDSLKTSGLSYSHLLHGTNFSINIDTSCFVEIMGWKTSFPYVSGDKYLYSTDYTQNEIEFDSVGIFLNNEQLAVDGCGSSTFYNKKHGIIRTSTYCAWTDEGQGWDRIK